MWQITIISVKPEPFAKGFWVGLVFTQIGLIGSNLSLCGLSKVCYVFRPALVSIGFGSPVGCFMPDIFPFGLVESSQSRC